MVSLRKIICTAVVGLSVGAYAWSPTEKCGWTGCNYEPDLISQKADGVRVSAPNSKDIISTLQKITQKSQALQAPAASLTIVNGPLIIAGLGPFPQIITGFTDIIGTANEALNSLENKGLATADQSDDLFEAYRDFVRVHQALLSILIGRAGLFTTVPFVGAPVAAVLRVLEGTVDTLAFLLIDTAQSRSTDIQALSASLGTTIDTAIKGYSGL